MKTTKKENLHQQNQKCLFSHLRVQNYYFIFIRARICVFFLFLFHIFI